MRIRLAELGMTSPNMIADVIQVLKSGRFINGPWAQRFGRAWAEVCGASECIPVASGSAALIAVLKQLRNTKSNKVILPDYSFAATAFAVKEAGLEPIYVSVDDRGLMDLKATRAAVREFEPLAVLPVHMYGQYLNLGRLPDEIMVVEDACQAHGITSLQGVAACYSFYPAKNLGAAGDAGAVVTNLKNLANQVRAYCNYGDFPGEKYSHTISGNNLRMDELQAAVLLHKLEYLHDHNQARQTLAAIYQDAGVHSLAKNPTNWHLYPILVTDPDEFIGHMAREEVEVGRHYPYRLSSIVPGTEFELNGNSDRLAKHVVTLPIGPHLVGGDILRVVELITKTMKFEAGLWV